MTKHQVAYMVGTAVIVGAYLYFYFRKPTQGAKPGNASPNTSGGVQLPQPSSPPLVGAPLSGEFSGIPDVGPPVASGTPGNLVSGPFSQPAGAPTTIVPSPRTSLQG